MQRATADYEMLDAALRRKVAPLKLPPPPPPPGPARATIDIPERALEYAEARRDVESTLFSADPVLSRMFKLVRDESFWMRETVLLLHEPQQLDPPLATSLFVQQQSAKLDEIKGRLTAMWLPAVEQHVQQELGALQEVEKCADMDAFEVSRVPRVLKQIALIMQDELKSMVLTSMGAYLALIKEYATFTPKELEAPPEQWVHALPTAMPALLSVTLRLDNGELVFEPPLDAVIASLNSILEAFVVHTAGIPAVGGGNSIVPMLDLPHEKLATLAQDDGSLAATRKELNELLETSMARPKQILGIFLKYSELVTVEINAHLASLRTKKLTLEQYSAEIEKWRTMSEQVVSATAPDVHCRLLTVACGELKMSLATKAEAIARGVAGLVVEELQSKADEIGATYKTIFDRLQESSGSAEDVIEMNNYLQATSAKLESLQASLESELDARVKLLDSVGAEMPDETFEGVFTTLAWPGRVFKVADDAVKKQEEDRNHFMEQLRNGTQGPSCERATGADVRAPTLSHHAPLPNSHFPLPMATVASIHPPLLTSLSSQLLMFPTLLSLSHTHSSCRQGALPGGT